MSTSLSAFPWLWLLLWRLRLRWRLSSRRRGDLRRGERCINATPRHDWLRRRHDWYRLHRRRWEWLDVVPNMVPPSIQSVGGQPACVWFRRRR